MFRRYSTTRAKVYWKGAESHEPFDLRVQHVQKKHRILDASPMSMRVFSAAESGTTPRKVVDDTSPHPLPLTALPPTTNPCSIWDDRTSA